MHAPSSFGAFGVTMVLGLFGVSGLVQRCADASERIAPIMGRMCASEGMLAHEITATVRQQRYAQRRRDGSAA